MTDIVRVWGTCDNIKIEFKYEGGKQWSCTVPPDFEDGIYVAEFWAQDKKGRIGHWSGFLYMSSGICHFKFKDEKYQLWLEPQKYKIKFNQNSKYQFDFTADNWKFEIHKSIEKPFKLFFQPQNYTINFIKEDNKNYKIEFKENRYDFVIFESEKGFDRRTNLIRNKLYRSLLLKQKVRTLVDKTTAKLGVAILGQLILGKKGNEDPILPTKTIYQIKIDTNRYKINLLDSKYKIFFEKRCEHWEL